MESIPSSVFTLLIGIALTIASVWYGQNHGLMPVEASVSAPAVDGLFNTMMTISTALFLMVQGILIFVAFRFRRKKGDNTDAAPVHGNIPLEILWTSIPAVIVLGLAIYSFDVYTSEGSIDPMSHTAHAQPTVKVASAMPGAAIAAPMGDMSGDLSMDDMNADLPQPKQTLAVADGIKGLNDGEKPSNTVEVNVTGLQFAWIFTYPNDGVVSGELHVPTDRPVVLNISANDVLHAFWVPEFRLKQDAIPGRTTRLQFIANRPGTYPVICAELCGSYHGGMKTQVHVYPPEEYDSWLQEQKAVAKGDAEQVLAINPTQLSPGDYLTPYGSELGVDESLLQQMHHHAMETSAAQL